MRVLAQLFVIGLAPEDDLLKGRLPSNFEWALCDSLSDSIFDHVCHCEHCSASDGACCDD